MMCSCGKCTKLTGIIFLVVGILFLLKDFNVWSFWGISWWAALFVIVGIVTIAQAGCKDCQAICGMSKKK